MASVIRSRKWRKSTKRGCLVQEFCAVTCCKIRSACICGGARLPAPLRRVKGAEWWQESNAAGSGAGVGQAVREERRQSAMCIHDCNLFSRHRRRAPCLVSADFLAQASMQTTPHMILAHIASSDWLPVGTLRSNGRRPLAPSAENTPGRRLERSLLHVSWNRAREYPYG
jgi:hypothetical protein